MEHFSNIVDRRILAQVLAHILGECWRSLAPKFVDFVRDVLQNPSFTTTSKKMPSGLHSGSVLGSFVGPFSHLGGHGCVEGSRNGHGTAMEEAKGTPGSPGGSPGGGKRLWCRGGEGGCVWTYSV